jgi:hypothetical protein
LPLQVRYPVIFFMKKALIWTFSYRTGGDLFC